jgi:RNA polymerase sigma factor (sigma-70 family)
MKKHRLVIADDHSIIRDGLRSMLENNDRFEIVAEAEDGLETVRCVRKHNPDLLILDLSMPKLSGLSVLNELKTRHPDVRIIVLTVHDSEEYFREVFKAGASGYCLKRNSFSELSSAMEHVMAGRVFVSPSITRPMLDGYLTTSDEDEPRSAWDTLTQREKEVLKLIGEGYKNKEIAELLNISPKTVEKHRSNLMSKLDLHNAQVLTAYAIKMGLVLPMA